MKIVSNEYFIFRDVQKYFHGHHITINARSEDEVCIDDILDKVSKASASKFNFNGEKQWSIVFRHETK